MAPDAEPAQPSAGTLAIQQVPGRSREQLLADVGMEGLASNAAIADSFLKPIGLGDGNLTECVRALRGHVADVKRGDLGFSETILVSQAAALNSLFAGLVTRASANMGEYTHAADTYMRLALRAQNQCRSTLETLAEIRNPKSVAFVRQANIANGPQQVNNGPATHAGEKDEIGQNEVLEVVDGEWMDAGAQGAAGPGDPVVAPVGTGDRTKDRRGKAARKPKRMEGRRAGAAARPCPPAA